MSRALSLLLLALSPQDPSALVDRLRSEKVEERDDAVRRLEAIGPPAIPALEKAAGDADLEVASRARHVLRVFKVRDRLTPRLRGAFPGLETLLAEGDHRAWTKAFLEAEEKVRPGGGLTAADLDALAPAAIRGASGEKETEKVLTGIFRLQLRLAVPQIVGVLLGEESAGERRSILEGLWALDREGAMEELVRSLADPNPRRREYAVWSLGRLEARHQTARIATLFADPDSEVADAAITVMVELDALEFVPQIGALLGAARPELRKAAAWAIGRLRAPGWTTELIRLLDDENEGVRYVAAHALELVGGRAAIPALIRRLVDPSANVRTAALEVLGNLGAVEAIPIIGSKLRTKGMSLAAVESLQNIAAPEAIPFLAPLLHDENASLRNSAMKALSTLGATESLEEIASLLEDKDRAIRNNALEAIADLGGRDAVRLIVPAVMQEKDTGLAARAVGILGELEARETIPEFEKRLAHAEPRWRALAASALGRLKSRESFDKIVPLLKDPVVEVRTSARGVISGLDPVAAIPVLLAALPDAGEPELGRIVNDLRLLLLRRPERDVVPLLKDRSPDARRLAALALSHPGEASVTEELVPLLRDEDPAVRRMTVVALRSRKDPERAKALLPLLKDSDASVRSAAAGTLADLGIKEALPGIRELIKDPDSTTAAIQGLGTLGSAADIPILMPYLKDEDAGVRWRTIDALAELKAKEAVPAILELLDDEYVTVREEVPPTLVTLGARETIPVLIRTLRDPERRMRQAAAEALGRFAVREAIPELVRALVDPEGRSRSGAEAAFDRMRGPEFVAPVVAFLDSPDPLIRKAAAKALEVMDARDRVPRLLRSLEDSDGRVREATAGALAALGAREAIPGLVHLLGDKDWQVRIAAMVALGRLDAGQAAAAIRRLLTDPVDRVRTQAMYVLVDLRALEAIPDLRPLLKDPVLSIRRAAAHALGRLEAREALPDIARLLALPATRSTAIIALGQLGDPEAATMLLPFLAGRREATRREAASSLCRLGRREGVAVLLAESVPSPDLNAVRRPRVWDRLRTKPLTADLSGPREEAAARLATISGLKLEAPDDPKWKQVPERISCRGGRLSLLEALLQLSDYSHPFVLEDDRVRFLEREAALLFWNAWWTEEGKKR